MDGLNKFQEMGEEDTTDLTEKFDENEGKIAAKRKENEKEEKLKESDDNCVGASNQKSAFTAVVNKRFEVPDGENSPNIPVSLSSATYFKPIVLNDSWSKIQEAQALKDQTHKKLKNENCEVNHNTENPPQKTIPALGKRFGNSTETFVSASRRVVEKLRQLEEVYTKQTSKGNLVKSTNKLSESGMISFFVLNLCLQNDIAAMPFLCNRSTFTLYLGFPFCLKEFSLQVTCPKNHPHHHY